MCLNGCRENQERKTVHKLWWMFPEGLVLRGILLHRLIKFIMIICFQLHKLLYKVRQMTNNANII
jgi:hypothetical protein